jgi:hypothetical protein
MNQPLRAITVRQPWAALIAAGVKRVENRGRPNSIRGEVAIHAGLQPDRDAPAGCADGLDLHFGAIVAVVTIADCHPVVAHDNGDWCCRDVGGLLVYGHRTAHHFTFTDIFSLPAPVPARGQLQLGWPVPADVETAVRAQLDSQEV